MFHACQSFKTKNGHARHEASCDPQCCHIVSTAVGAFRQHKSNRISKKRLPLDKGVSWCVSIIPSDGAVLRGIQEIWHDFICREWRDTLMRTRMLSYAESQRRVFGSQWTCFRKLDVMSRKS